MTVGELSSYSVRRFCLSNKLPYEGNPPCRNVNPKLFINDKTDGHLCMAIRPNHLDR